MGKSRKRSRERRYENLTAVLHFYHTLAIFFCSDHGCKMLRANWRPLLFIFPDHVPIPGRQGENRENGHSDQRAEGDLQAGQLSVLQIPLFSLINYSTLDSQRNTVISHAVMASKTVTRSSLLQYPTESEGVNRVIENNASDTLSLTDLKAHFSLRRSRKS